MMNEQIKAMSVSDFYSFALSLPNSLGYKNGAILVRGECIPRAESEYEEPEVIQVYRRPDMTLYKHWVINPVP